jgi:hypothetical protein
MLYAAWIVEKFKKTNNLSDYSPTGPIMLILPLRVEKLSLHCFVESHKPKMPIPKQQTD